MSFKGFRISMWKGQRNFTANYIKKYKEKLGPPLSLEQFARMFFKIKHGFSTQDHFFCEWRNTISARHAWWAVLQSHAKKRSLEAHAALVEEFKGLG